jgi:exo-beta-1,3-glucanase (GH17 family)
MREYRKEASMSKISIVAACILIALISVNCSCKADSNAPAEEKTDSLQQSTDQLLAGHSLAVAYSGFRQGQHPDRGDGAVNPSEEEILEDLQILTRGSSFGLIRVYDSQQNAETVLRMIKANDIKLKVMLGIWLSAEISNHEGCSWLPEPIPADFLAANRVKNEAEVERGISLANEYQDIVVAVNVGNEALVSWTDHMVGVDAVRSYVRKVKSSVSQPVTVAENYEWWATNGTQLAGELDFISVHTYPVWEGKDIDEGLSYTIENLEAVRATLPDSSMVISELGWATVASEFGDRASEEKQLQYYTEVIEWSTRRNITVFWFEAFDEDWKGDPANPLGAEKHWGLFTVDRKAKLAMRTKYPEMK